MNSNKIVSTIVPPRRDKHRINIMVAGESGQGKTTFLSCLLRRYVQDFIISQNSDFTEKTVSISELGRFEVFASNGDGLDVILHDAPGYGDFINNQDAIDRIKDFILVRHKDYRSLDLQSLSTVEALERDTRIHVVFYFISSHRMKAIDSEFIAQLAPLVPIIPIIAKADTMTVQERNRYIFKVTENLDAISERIGGPCVYDFGHLNQPCEVVGCTNPPESIFLQVGTSLLQVEEVEEESINSRENNCLSDLLAEDQSLYSSTHTQALSESMSSSLEYVIASYADEVKYGNCEVSTRSLDLMSSSSSVVSQGRRQCFGDGIGGPSSTSQSSVLLSPDSTEGIESRSYMSESVPSVMQSQQIAPSAPIPVRLPNIFAVVCDISNERVYPWGTLRIDDMTHSDFRRLQILVFENNVHMKALIDLTHEKTRILFPSRSQVESKGLVEDAEHDHIVLGENIVASAVGGGKDAKTSLRVSEEVGCTLSDTPAARPTRARFTGFFYIFKWLIYRASFTAVIVVLFLSCRLWLRKWQNGTGEPLSATNAKLDAAIAQFEQLQRVTAQMAQRLPRDPTSRDPAAPLDEDDTRRNELLSDLLIDPTGLVGSTASSGSSSSSSSSGGLKLKASSAGKVRPLVVDEGILEAAQKLEQKWIDEENEDETFLVTDADIVADVLTEAAKAASKVDRDRRLQERKARRADTAESSPGYQQPQKKDPNTTTSSSPKSGIKTKAMGENVESKKSETAASKSARTGGTSATMGAGGHKNARSNDSAATSTSSSESGARSGASAWTEKAGQHIDDMFGGLPSLRAIVKDSRQAARQLKQEWDSLASSLKQDLESFLSFLIPK